LQERRISALRLDINGLAQVSFTDGFHFQLDPIMQPRCVRTFLTGLRLRRASLQGYMHLDSLQGPFTSASLRPCSCRWCATAAAGAAAATVAAAAAGVQQTACRCRCVLFQPMLLLPLLLQPMLQMPLLFPPLLLVSRLLGMHAATSAAGLLI
jgi:hypothetical protein